MKNFIKNNPTTELECDNCGNLITISTEDFIKNGNYNYTCEKCGSIFNINTEQLLDVANALG